VLCTAGLIPRFSSFSKPRLVSQFVTSSQVLCDFFSVFLYSERWRCHKRFLAALPETHWFKWTYFHERVLLFLQLCCQGHCAADEASGRDKGFTAAVSRSFRPRCWVRGFVKCCDVSMSGSTTRYSDRKLFVVHFRIFKNVEKIAPVVSRHTIIYK
jgi:hypothetical protein